MPQWAAVWISINSTIASIRSGNIQAGAMAFRDEGGGAISIDTADFSGIRSLLLSTGRPPGGGEQLPECLRNFLRPFFPKVQVGNFKSISPVDDARFIGVPKLGTIAAAITAGLYNIYYDPQFVDLTGGSDSSSISTIAEEVAHAVQFIAVWERVENSTGVSGSYNRARDSWALSYFSDSGRVLLGNIGKATSFWITGPTAPLEDPYADNKYEVEAKVKAKEVYDAARRSGNPCFRQ